MSFLLSWQTWLCGGSVEILPCSRVGHLYRNEDAHSQREREATLQNKVRIAETWLGSFKETFYRHSPEALSLSKVRGSPAEASGPTQGSPSWRLGQEYLPSALKGRQKLPAGTSMGALSRGSPSRWSCPLSLPASLGGGGSWRGRQSQLVLASNPRMSVGQGLSSHLKLRPFTLGPEERLGGA